MIEFATDYTFGKLSTIPVHDLYNRPCLSLPVTATVEEAAALMAEADRGWWLWTCLAGFGLGVIGWDYCRRRRNHRRDREAAAGTQGPAQA